MSDEVEWKRPPDNWSVEVTAKHYSDYYKSDIFPYFKKRIPALERNLYVNFWLPYICVGSFILLFIFGFILLPKLYSVKSLSASYVIFGIIFCSIIPLLALILVDLVYSKKVTWKNYFPLVIEKSINFIHPELDYKAKDYVRLNAIRESKIFSNVAYSQYKSYSLAGGSLDIVNGLKTPKGEDLISGKVGDTKITFSEVSFFHTPYRKNLVSELAVDVGSFLISEMIHSRTGIRTDLSRSSTKSHETLRFSGVFAVVDFNKDFQCETVVIPKTNILSNKHSLLSPNPELDLENPHFENFFHVYSNSQIGARYILTPDFMERIMQFTSKFYHSRRYGNVFFSFVNSKMYIAVETHGVTSQTSALSMEADHLVTRGHLDPKTFFNKREIEQLKTGRVPGFIQNYYFDITNFVDIVKDFDLNTRIWSKKLKKSEISKDTIYNLDGTVAYQLSYNKKI